ncbi:Uncharacterised protein [Bordetella pertussis]|nr:Uncharacterised protein [Bordetella pertussis]
MASGAAAALMPRARQPACESALMSTTWILAAGQTLPARPLARAAAMLPPPMNAMERSFFIVP